jgi:hypothetical protein
MKRWKLSLAAVLAVGVAGSAVAGPYSDDLGKCMVNATTKEDRAGLIRWIFVAASRHPAIKSIAAVTDQQIEDANKTMANLMTSLITVTCRAEAQKAMQYEGAETFRLGFEVLGQVAGRELFTSPEVVANMTGLVKYIDKDKFKAIMPPAAPPPPNEPAK